MIRTTMLFGALLSFAATAVGEPTYRVFVTNEKGNSVSVIDTRTNSVEKVIDVGEQPRGIGIAPDGSAVYVALGDANAIAVIDPRELSVTGKLDSGNDPETFAVHPNGNLYISNEEDAKASVTDPKTGHIVAEIPVGLEPEGVSISPDGSRVIITSESTNMLHIVSVPEHQVVHNVLVGARPRAAVFSNDSKWAYATAEIGGEVLKVNIETGEIALQGALGEAEAKPKDVLLSADEKVLYVAGGRANGVFALDAETLKVMKKIETGKRVWGLAMNRDKTRLYSTNGASNTVSIIDTATNTVVGSVDVGEAPWGVVIDD